jgi:hypothetical protein
VRIEKKKGILEVEEMIEKEEVKEKNILEKKKKIKKNNQGKNLIKMKIKLNKK